MSEEDSTTYHIETAKSLSRIEQVGLDTLEQVKKTNGRVTKLEGQVAIHDTAFALMSAANTRTAWWKDKIGSVLIGMSIAGIGAILVIILQKTDIIDVSVVTPDEFDQIETIAK